MYMYMYIYVYNLSLYYSQISQVGQDNKYNRCIPNLQSFII